MITAIVARKSSPMVSDILSTPCTRLQQVSQNAFDAPVSCFMHQLPGGVADKTQCISSPTLTLLDDAELIATVNSMMESRMIAASSLGSCPMDGWVCIELEIHSKTKNTHKGGF
eukprot:5930921-Amphidinium_carterae.1